PRTANPSARSTSPSAAAARRAWSTRRPAGPARRSAVPPPRQRSTSSASSCLPAHAAESVRPRAHALRPRGSWRSQRQGTLQLGLAHLRPALEAALACLLVEVVVGPLLVGPTAVADR